MSGSRSNLTSPSLTWCDFRELPKLAPPRGETCKACSRRSARSSGPCARRAHSKADRASPPAFQTPKFSHASWPRVAEEVFSNASGATLLVFHRDSFIKAQPSDVEHSQREGGIILKREKRKSWLEIETSRRSPSRRTSRRRCGRRCARWPPWTPGAPTRWPSRRRPRCPRKMHVRSEKNVFSQE